MKLKLDENLGRRAAALLAHKGHDVLTVPEQKLCSATDERIAALERGRSLSGHPGLDFANCLRFSPTDRPGIAVLRPPPRSGWEGIEACLRTLLEMLDRMTLDERLWVVEPGRIREHRHGEQDG